MAHSPLTGTRILLVGAGALGCRLATLLCQAGATRLTILDPDIVEERNLSRQPLYTKDDIGQEKAIIAATRLQGRFPETHTTGTSVVFQHGTNLAGIDLVLEGTDTLAARRVIDAACRTARIPAVFGMVGAASGMVFASLPDEPCLACVLDDRPEGETCEELDVTVADAVARAQVDMALASMRGGLSPRLLVIDRSGVRTVEIRKRAGCRACAGEPPVAASGIILRACTGTGRLQAHLGATIPLERVVGERLDTYPAAIRVRLGTGWALVHRHGLVEFDGVTREEATGFADALARP